MKKKILSITLVVALVAIAAMGTIAYFTDKEEVNNVMQFGKVDITLTEPAWNPDPDNKPVLYPGISFDKDPTIKLTADSLPSWMLLDVKADIKLVKLMAANEGLTVEELMAEMEASHTFREEVVNKWLIGIDHEAWEVMGFAEKDGQLVVRLGYKTVLQPKDEVVFMIGIQTPDTVTNEMIMNADITGEVNLGFVAYAVQANPVDTLEAAAAEIPEIAPVPVP